MGNSSKFKERVSELSEKLKNATQKLSDKEKCIPTMLIAAVIVPILVWILLYFLKPKFVQKQEGGKFVRDGTKVFYWTVLATVVVWICMYLFTYCQGYTGASVCAKV